MLQVDYSIYQYIKEILVEGNEEKKKKSFFLKRRYLLYPVISTHCIVAEVISKSKTQIETTINSSFFLQSNFNFYIIFLIKTLLLFLFHSSPIFEDLSDTFYVYRLNTIILSYSE